jgi:Protein of unknown function (DUF2853)
MAGSQVDYGKDIKKYSAAVNEAAVAGVVKHCGIALRSKDASLVSATDPAELARVRDSFLKKKLALTQSDAELDGAIAELMQKMKGVREKSRVTVYYLLAEKFGKLDMFAAKGKSAKA